MKSRKKIRLFITDCFVFSVAIILILFTVYSCVQEFGKQKPKENEQKINESYHRQQISNLEKQISILQKEKILLSVENNNLIQETKYFKTENELITQEKQEVADTLAKLTEKQNELLKTASLASQLGLSKPEDIGFTPIFQLTLDSASTEDKFTELSRGSYQRKKEIIKINIDDLNSWENLGDWKFTGYTATVEECDSSPSITANNSLVTPGFTLAVDPKYWEYGTIFYIDGLGFAIAADSGSAIKGKNRGDILVADKTFSAHLTGHRNVWLVYLPKSAQ